MSFSLMCSLVLSTSWVKASEAAFVGGCGRYTEDTEAEHSI